MVRSAAAIRRVNSSCSSCSSSSVAADGRPADDWSCLSVSFSFCRAPLITVSIATLPSSWRTLQVYCSDEVLQSLDTKHRMRGLWLVVFAESQQAPRGGQLARKRCLYGSTRSFTGAGICTGSG